MTLETQVPVIIDLIQYGYWLPTFLGCKIHFFVLALES